MRILFVGDVVGKAGRKLLKEKLRKVQSEVEADFTIVNVENAAGGFGVTGSVWDELRRLPVDVFTSGNHIWDKKEALPYLEREPRLLRPANYPAVNPGRSSYVFRTADGLKEQATVGHLARGTLAFSVTNLVEVESEVREREERRKTPVES